MHPPQDATYNGTRRSLRFQLARSSKNDWEHCKIIKCKEMEKAIIVANFTDGLRTLFHAKPRISQVLKESEDTLIHSQYRRLGLWAEHFRARFNCPTAKMDLPAMLPSEKNASGYHPSIRSRDGRGDRFFENAKGSWTRWTVSGLLQEWRSVNIGVNIGEGRDS